MPIEMRPSRVLTKLRRGEIVSSIKMNCTDPRIAELAGFAGFDCLWLDMEHTANSLLGVENLIRAGKLHDMDTVVRVPRGRYTDLIYPLEMDAAGVMVPHVMSLEDARQIIYYTRFHPLGRRPLDGGNTDGAYCLIPGPDYMRQANEQRFVVLQIEDPEPLSELDQIAQLPGLDMLLFGPGDFSQGIGAPYQFDDPRIAKARRQVAEAARRHGKFAGTVGTVDDLPELTSMGYQFINIGADVFALAGYFRDLTNRFQSAVQSATSA